MTFTGNTAATITKNDLDPTIDLADIQEDVAYLSGLSQASVNWRWYEEGYTFAGYTGAPDVGPASDPSDSLADYIEHHNAPQYFGYVAANTALNQNLQSYKQFFADINDRHRSVFD